MDLFELKRYDPPIEKMKAFKENAYLALDHKMLFIMVFYGLVTLALGFTNSVDGDGKISFIVAISNFIMHTAFNFLPRKGTRRYLLGFTLAVFTISFFYFSQGAVYAHISIILSLIILSLYGNWRILIPYIIIITLHYTFSIVNIKMGHTIWSTYLFSSNLASQNQFILIFVLISLAILITIFYLTQYINQLITKEGKSLIYLKDQLNVDLNVALVNQIAKGDLESNYTIKDNDKIGAALYQMRENIKQTYEQEQKTQWISDGIAHIGDILLTSSDVSEICHNVLREIIRYISLEHGGIFIVNNADVDNPYLELRSFFAFDQPDFIERKIHFGEGLVGEVATRKTSLLLNEIPENFESISSGLGSSAPKNIFITPLMVKDDIMGVLEFSSLRDFEPHELDLIEKVSANIALSVLSANAATQTTRLLTESQVYNEQMKAQEEEMRSSMEALRQTQDELSRQVEARASVQSELSTRMNVVDRMAIVSEIDLDGQLIYVNEQFIKTTGYKRADCLGQNFDILRHPNTSEHIFKEIWLTINRNDIYVGSFKSQTVDGEVVWFECAIAPVTDHENKPTKFLCIGFDITELKQKEQDIENLLEQAKARNAMLNHKEESMHRNLEALEIAEEELSEQIQMSIRNQEFYDLVLTFVKGIVYRSVLDNQWVIEYLSTGTYELTGYDHTDFIGNKVRAFSSIIHPDDLPLIEESIDHDLTIIEESSNSKVKGFRVKYRIIKQNGEIRWVEERGKKFYDHYLKKEILTGFIYDITDSIITG